MAAQIWYFFFSKMKISSPNRSLVQTKERFVALIIHVFLISYLVKCQQKTLTITGSGGALSDRSHLIAAALQLMQRIININTIKTLSWKGRSRGLAISSRICLLDRINGFLHLL